MCVINCVHTLSFYLSFGLNRCSWFFTINIEISEQAMIDSGKYRKTLNTFVTLNTILVKHNLIVIKLRRYCSVITRHNQCQGEIIIIIIFLNKY